MTNCTKEPQNDVVKPKNGAIDLISRRDAIDALDNIDYTPGEWVIEGMTMCKDAIKCLPSAEPKTGTVLCALADRTCPFQGKEIAWCLTCPHISEEDRGLLKEAISEPKTGKWIYCEDEAEEYVDGYRCDQCGYFVPWDFKHKSPYFIEEYHYCPSCKARMKGDTTE